jgi:hypothetical protein
VSLIGEVILAFVVESVLLAGAWVAIALVGAGTAGAIPRIRGHIGHRFAARTLLVAALVGTVVVGSLAHRFSAPEPWLLAIGRRLLPVVWSLAGAVAGAVMLVVAAARRSTADDLSRKAAEAPVGSRAGDGAPPSPDARTPR